MRDERGSIYNTITDYRLTSVYILSLVASTHAFKFVSANMVYTCSFIGLQ